MVENDSTEYKEKLTAGLEKEVVAFLNAHGGTIFIGVDRNGNAVGMEKCDAVQLEIKDRLITGIRPSVMGLFDIGCEDKDGKQIVRITVAAGKEPPYYIRANGMSERGCFIRIGSSAHPMTQDQIDALYYRRTHTSLRNIPSPNQCLDFTQLHIYYAGKKLVLNDYFADNLQLKTDDGRYNMIAYLCADENGMPMLFAKYAGTDRDVLTENKNFGYCSLIKATEQILDKFAVENRIYARVTATRREERPMVDPQSLREAVINAILHNDYSYSNPPKFEMFSDRIEITSTGGLPWGMTKEDFFNGKSCPRNPELMRIFQDMELVERLGSGVRRILNAYAPDVFEISDTFFRVTFRYNKPFDETTPEEATQKTGVKTRGKTREKILSLIRQNPTISAAEMAEKLGLTVKGVEWQLAKLKSDGAIIRIGAANGGKWRVNDDRI